MIYLGRVTRKLGYLFSENLFKAPKRKDCNDVFLAKKYVASQSILPSKEPSGNKRFLLFGFPGGNSFLFCSFLVGASGYVG